MKKIKKETDFLKLISKKPKRKNVLLSIGDDAAIVQEGKKKLLFASDMFVEEDHFSIDYFSPEQIGMKAVEANASDIYAMGGEPKYILVSVALKKNLKPEFAQQLFKGIHKACAKHKIDLIGGDTTHSKLMTIDITIIGELKGNATKRSNAKTGDLILVSGKLGGSTAGLKLLRKKIKGFEKIKKKHLEPKARKDIAEKIKGKVGAVEDVSDGLATEIRNICQASKKGAVIYWEKIPINNETKKIAELFNETAEDYALFGGEDFELVFTVARKNLDKVLNYGTVVGEIINGKKIFLKKNGKQKELKKFGFDHFAEKNISD